MSAALWLAALILLIAVAVVVSGRGRASPSGLVRRRTPLGLALLVAALGTATPWVWGGAAAIDGRADRLREGVPVRLAIAGVAVDVQRPTTIGWSATAEVRLPGGERDTGDVARLERRGDDIVLAAAAPTTRIGVGRGDPARIATAAMRADGCATPANRDTSTTAPPATTTAPATASATAPAAAPPAAATATASTAATTTVAPGEVVVAIACRDGAPRTAIAVRRGTADERVELVPLRWRGRFAPTTLEVRAGDVLQLGAVGVALPGVTAWEMPARAGQGALLAVPADPTACAAWDGAMGSSTETGGPARVIDGRCVVGDGTFALVARPIAPDADGVVGRGIRVAIAVTAPVVLLLVCFAAAVGSRRRARVVAALARVGVVAAGLAALLAWRLVWAHRIDVLRDLEPDGARVAANLLSTALVAASLAGVAISRLVDGAAVRVASAFVAWAVWAGVALLVLDVPIAIDRASAFHVAGQLLLSMACAVGLPLLERLAAARLAAGRRVATAARDAGLEPDADDSVVPPHVPLRERARAWFAALGPGHALLAIAALAAATRAVAPSFVLAKLGLAYGVVIAGHAALRSGLAPGAVHRRAFHLAALIPAVATVVALDVGVAVVIVGVGLALAMIVAGHDAVYDAGQAPRIGVLEREHARLVGLHGLAAIAGAVVATGWALAAGDQDLLERSTLAMLHAPLAVAVLFAVAGAVARSHRRPWTPWLAAALAALAVWGARDVVLDRALASDGVGAHRVAVVVDPGYALLRDDHRFVASVSAWREAALPADVDPWVGQGYFGARLADPGVVVSVENDYLPVLIARERGVGGLVQTTLLLLALVVAAGATAAARLGHASRAHRARWMVAAVVGALCVYQPLASLGVLPLTGISWPGLGIDSPADLWLFVLGAFWLFLGADQTAIAGAGAPAMRFVHPALASSERFVVEGAVGRAGLAPTPRGVDERIRSAPRLRRARRVAAAALAITAIAGVTLVARAGDSALGRGVTAARRGAASGDRRIDRALAYAASLTCPWADRTGATVDEVVPPVLVAAAFDASTLRFDRELAATWAADRAPLVARLTAGTCAGRAGGWALTADPSGACRAELDAGWPAVHLAVTRTGEAWRATCAVELPDDAVPLLDRRRPPRAPRIRLVSAPVGVAAADLGELVGPDAIIRIRPAAPAPAPASAAPPPSTGKSRKKQPAVAVAPAVNPFAPALALAADTVAAGFHVAASVELGGGVTIAARVDQHDVVVRGPAEVLVAAAATGDAPTAWQRQPAATGDRVLDRLALIIGGEPGRRRVWLFRPPRAFGPDAPPSIDPLLADDVRRAGDRTRRAYPYGAALPELGWTNPFDVDHSLGLDGWVHAALAERDPAPAALSPAVADPSGCGTLAPPPIERARVCSPSPLDGVLECRVALQPELALALAATTARLIDDPTTTLGRAIAPTRAAYVVLRGDTGEVLAQGDVIPGRGPSAYAPADAAAETTLIRLREDRDPVTGAPAARGESDGERADWNLPIAVGSTLKPLVARAAEQAFPAAIPDLLLTAIGRADTACRRTRSGRTVPPMLGHCPPTPLSSEPTTADLHDFLARSPNWYMAALGLIGLGLPAGQLAFGDTPIALGDVVLSDLAAWPTERPLAIADAAGPILGPKGVVVDGLRRTPLWSRFEAVLGRPLCTLGDQASCRRAGERRDVCAARALPVPVSTSDLRHLVALGPDRLDFYGDDRKHQRVIATREYFQLLRGSGVHPIGSLAQLTDAFGRVVYDPAETGALRLAASWFPSPPVGVTPAYRCTDASGHANTVRGADGGLCAVMQVGGTAHAALSELLADPRIAIYGGKTGTVDSLADVARRPAACAAWNERHTVAGPRDPAHQPGWLACGSVPPDDSLFVLAFGVVTPHGTIPITLGVQLQRGGKGTAARAARRYVDAIAAYLQ